MREFDGHQDAYIPAVGDSHVRSFSYHPAFLPLFIGPGKSINFVTDENARVARDRLKAVISRLDVDLPVMLVFGEPDVRMHLEDRFGTQSEYVSDSDALHVFVSRYTKAIDAIQAELPNDLLVYNSIPTLRVEHNLLARKYNDFLEEACKAKDIPYIDVWADLVGDQKSLDEQYAAEHIHLNERVAPFVVEKLVCDGWLPETIAKKEPYSWAFNHTFALEEGFDVRVWGDAELDPESPRFVRTGAYAKASEIVQDAIKGLKTPRLIVMPSTEGFIPFQLSTDSFAEAILHEPDNSTARAASRLVSFTGRESITVTDELPSADDIRKSYEELAFVGVLDGGAYDEEIETTLESIEHRVTVIIDEGGGELPVEFPGNRGFLASRSIPYSRPYSVQDGLDITVTFQSRIAYTLFTARRLVSRTRALFWGTLEATMNALRYVSQRFD